MLNVQLVGVVLGVALASSSLVVEASGAGVPCGVFESQTAGCPSVSGSANDEGVDLVGTVTYPGSSGTRPQSGSGPIRAPGVVGTPPVRDGYTVTSPVRDGYTITSPVRLEDLVNFRPTSGVHRMEPDGWMVVGLDTNFYALVTGGVQTGELLGQPATVRFDATRFRWDYGDGTGATRATGGGSWASQNIAEFDPTATSHVYRLAGTYSIGLTIEFAAEYRFADGPWTPIAGTIPVTSNRLTATAGDAKTVLVNRDCLEDSAGPGC
jgi:hypothetical protein